MAGIDIISDSTGKEIVAAIQSTDVAQARILEINTAAEAKKNEVLESIPEDYSNISKEVDELKDDLVNFSNNLLEEELFDISKTIDGFYPTQDSGLLAPNSDAGTTDFLFVKQISEFTVNASVSGAHNIVFYDKNHNYVYGIIKGLKSGEPFTHKIEFANYPTVYYMRVAYYISEKNSFSIIGKSALTIKDFKSSVCSLDKSIDFSHKKNINNWSLTNLDTFWFTDTEDMQELRGSVLKSITINCKTSGNVLSIMGYKGKIIASGTVSELRNGAINANANSYTLFKIINSTAGLSTYLLDGTDERVVIIEEDLICPSTIGLYNTGDTALFGFYDDDSLSDISYFTHANYTDEQKRASRLCVQFTAEDKGLNIQIDQLKRSFNIFVSKNDLNEILQKEQDEKRYLKMNCLGDSITYGYIPDNGLQMAEPYPSQLKKILNLIEVRNYGISGSTLAVNDGNYQPMSVRYADMDNDADIISVFGGTNDYGRAVYTRELGTINDSVNTTIYGALNILCSGLIEKYPRAFIFFITPMRRSDKTGNNDGGYTLEDVSKAIKEVAYKYNLPVLDLYSFGGFHTENSTFRSIYSGNDRLHPSQAFVTEHLAPMIAKFIDSNM